MHPALHINWLAILAATVASFVFAFLWHGPLFGKTWARLMNVSMTEKPAPGVMTRSLGLQLLGTFITAYVLVFTGEVWRPSVWNAGADAPAYVYGFFNGLWIWLGFFVPMQLSAVAWEKRSWSLFGLNVTYHFLNLQIMAMILAFWR